MEVDQLLHSFCSGVAFIVILIQINNGVIKLNSPDAISNFNNVVCTELNIKWSDQMQQIVGLECVFGEGEVAITQQRLTYSILEAFQQLTTFSSASGNPGTKSCFFSGSIPDLAFVVNYLTCHSMGPTAEHWEMMDHVVGYLLKTRNQGIQICLGNLSLSLWSNVGWGGDLKFLQEGFIIKLGNAPVLWGLKGKSVLALSTCAAKYVALSDSTQNLEKETGWRFHQIDFL
ncbi:hypothetical protein O181_098342 [Austropuccinia psidii MF-1]|uniref:Uncharacterized protein n=1 Tax=Austropuccinia psidii MF-1 TaxID=1389203 RepID=A0A9Q3JA79_9BASI|nr:hypothetical protein [Austropuccinia psidii MF-1]